jgi:hypothetical protein
MLVFVAPPGKINDSVKVLAIGVSGWTNQSSLWNIRQKKNSISISFMKMVSHSYKSPESTPFRLSAETSNAIISKQ